MRSKIKLSKLKNFILLFISLFIFGTNPAHAYGGPGIGLGAIIVLITVIITFLASVFITFLKYLKELKRNINQLYKRNKNKNKNKNKNNN